MAGLARIAADPDHRQPLRVGLGPAPAASVVLEGVRHRYKRTLALDGVSLEIPAGASVALIGPDGVGKSTLLGLIAGSKRLQEGSVRTLGADMGARAEREGIQPRIAFMPQGLGRNLYPSLSVRENIEFFARLFGHRPEERAKRIPPLLEATGLAPFPDRLMGQLSGGMKQKLGLCCALIHDPDLLILDEPTTGVDPLSRRQFWELVEGIKRTRPHLTVLVATSYMDEAERFERAVMMDGGRILADGAPTELRARTGTHSLERAFVTLLPEDRRFGSGGEPVRAAPGLPAGSALVAIEARDLTRRFGDFTAVDRISFTIRRGEIFGFLGSNGCGKTTTMKMLTGLLPASSGEAYLFGRPVDPRDIETRSRVGYMSQSFSLYGELTVRQNLKLHAELFGLPPARVAERSQAVTARFGLGPFLDRLPDALPLGVRQRLSLAVALIHEPEILILDEPTSGVDPVARDMFWDQLLRLSREQGVTIFVSTHFMSEAARCDRVAFMHAGRVIAAGKPDELQQARGATSLEDAFVAYMQLGGREAGAAVAVPRPIEQMPDPAGAGTSGKYRSRTFSTRRFGAYAWREAIELRRDPVRLTFAMLGTALLMLILGFGLSLDVEALRFAVLDHDQTPESRAYIEQYEGSRYFVGRPPLKGGVELQARLQSNDIAVALEIPPGFGSDLRRGRPTEVSVWIDGAMPFRAETIRGYVAGLHARFLEEAAQAAGLAVTAPAEIEVRFRYNQAFRSLEAMVPANIALLLVIIPAVLTALAVVREKELGSITNLYVTPTSRLEFLLGKQLPYIVLALINFALLVALAILFFGVPIKGSLLGLVLGAVLYVMATTAIGLVASALTRTQTAAIFGTAVATMMPAVQFSGLLRPVSSLEGGAWLVGTLFPTSHFMKISVGAFTKGLALPDLVPFLLATAAFTPVLLLLAAILLRKQEA